MRISYTVTGFDNEWATLETYQREVITIPKLWLPSCCKVGNQVLAEIKLSDDEGMVEFTVAKVFDKLSCS